VLVFQPIEDSLPLLSGCHDSRQSEFCKVLRHRGRRLVYDLGESIYGQLTIAQRQNDTNAGRIGEHPEHFDCELNELAIWLSPTHLLICIHTQIISRVTRPSRARASARRRDEKVSLADRTSGLGLLVRVTEHASEVGLVVTERQYNITRNETSRSSNLHELAVTADQTDPPLIPQSK
jgi:hypothetical protein